MKNWFKLTTALVLSVLLLYCVESAAAQARMHTSAGIIQSNGWVDWRSNTFVLQVTFEPQGETGPLPLLRSKAETAIERNLPKLFIEAISPVIINSRQRIGDTLIDSPEKTAQFRKLAGAGKIVSSRFSRDFSKFHRIFHYSLYPNLSEHFVAHPRAVSQTAELTYVASGRYSGIVIFVDDPIEIHGSHHLDTLQPALFPRIYNDEMDIIIDKTMVQPEIINTRGMINYYHTSEIDMIHSRVGEVPLYVHAKALFGVHSTDLVVTDRAARKIKADSHTLSLINQGRIAVVSSSALLLRSAILSLK